jgi:DNA invertase Pin-like site-specific DNA recombinase
MKQIGYVYMSLDADYITEQMTAIKKYGVTNIILSDSDLDLLNVGDELVVYELKSLGKTIRQLGSFSFELHKKKIKLKILKKEKSLEKISEDQWLELLFDIAEMDTFVISERTSRGIQDAKVKGVIGGRPKVSDLKIEKIKYLYEKRGYTLREIADECEVSLGTAYKYIQKID